MISASIEGVNVPGFNKLVHLQKFEKCKIQKFSRAAGPRSPPPEMKLAPSALAQQTNSLFGKTQT